MNKKSLTVIAAIALVACIGVGLVYAAATIMYNDAPPVVDDIINSPTPAPTATPTPSPSPSPSPTVITGNQTISFLEAKPHYAGQDLTVIVTLDPAHATSVTLYINGNPYRTVTSTAFGVATFAITGAEIGAGTYTFTAKADSVTVP